MTLAGTRPPTVDEWELYEPHHRARMSFRPGLTGMWQVSGRSNITDFEEVVKLDTQYISEWSLRLDTYGRETHFIPNGVNRPETREAGLITEKFGLTKDSYILFLGRLVPEKGIRYLVEAFKDVKTDKKLVIAGGSSDTDSFMVELKELAKDDNRIIFTGFVQGQILFAIIRSRMSRRKRQQFSRS